MDKFERIYEIDRILAARRTPIPLAELTAGATAHASRSESPNRLQGAESSQPAAPVPAALPLPEELGQCPLELEDFGEEFAEPTCSRRPQQ